MPGARRPSDAAKCLEAKTITAAEARTLRFRKVLWKYLGSTEVGNGPDVTLLQLLPRDRLVLCTKGVHNVLSDERILQAAGEYVEAQKCADALCKTALDRGSRDNVSSMVVEIGPSTRSSQLPQRS
jgi:protein phosphatase